MSLTIEHANYLMRGIDSHEVFNHVEGCPLVFKEYLKYCEDRESIHDLYRAKKINKRTHTLMISNAKLVLFQAYILAHVT